MSKKIIVSGIAIFIVFTVCALASFGQVHNINLQSGKKTTIKGQVRAGEGNEQLYIFEAKAHQNLSVKLDSINDNAVFSVNEQYRVDRSPIEIDGQPIENQMEEWSGELPEAESNGLYSVAITSTKGVASFTLEITLSEGGSADNSSADSSSGNGENLPDVKEYFLKIPQKYCGYTREDRDEFLESGDTHVDIEKGHIVAYTGTLGETFEISLFSKPDGGYVIAYNEDMDTGGSVPTKFYLLENEGNQWTNVTAQLLPVPINKSYRYNLSDDGKSITVENAKGTKVYSLVWVNGRFEKR